MGMTSMTIIDDLLVLLDDEAPRDLETISTVVGDRSKQTLSSTLGRLIAKGWIERVSGRGKNRYRISKAGRNHVTSLLGQIKYHTDRTWDGQWQQVVFNIPERDRKRRDELRKLLVDCGYGRLHNSLWLSPWSNRDTIEAYIRDTKSEHDITILDTGAVTKETSVRIATLFEWDWESLENDYAGFVAEAAEFMRQKAKDGYNARRIVFHYAKILATDPKFPAQLPVRTKSAKEAFDLYEKIRPYCYEE